MIIEMRTYRTKPGMREEFLAIFKAESMPAHREIGMKIMGPFPSIEDADTFFFMRAFPNLARREPMKAQFYEGELWKQELEHKRRAGRSRRRSWRLAVIICNYLT